MRLNIVLAVATLSLGLTAVQAFAQGEGAGEPFAFRAPAMISQGWSTPADTGAAAYPVLSGWATEPSSLAALDPAFGSEAAVQTANNLPAGSSNGTVASVQATRLATYTASRHAVVHAAGEVVPRS